MRYRLDLLLTLLLTAFACEESGADPIHVADAAGQPQAADAELPVPDAGAEPEDAAAPDDGLLANGAPLAWEQCYSCHGPDGEGSAKGYELRHPKREYFRWVVRNGRPGTGFEDSEMEAFDEVEVSDEDLEAIMDWLGALEQPSTGEGLYLDYCANCHGADGRGGVVRVDVVHEARRPARVIDVVRRGEGGREYWNRRDYMPAWPAWELGDDEIGLIAEHLRSL